MTGTPAREASSDDRVHVGHLAEQVDRHQRARARRDRRAQPAPASRLNVAGSMSTSTGVAPTRADGAGRREERVRAGDDLVAGPMPSAISATSSASVPDATPMACLDAQSAPPSPCSKALDLGAHDEALAVADARDRRRAPRRGWARTAPGDRAAGRAWDESPRSARRARSRSELKMCPPVRPFNAFRVSTT